MSNLQELMNSLAPGMVIRTEDTEHRMYRVIEWSLSRSGDYVEIDTYELDFNPETWAWEPDTRMKTTVCTPEYTEVTEEEMAVEAVVVYKWVGHQRHSDEKQYYLVTKSGEQHPIHRDAGRTPKYDSADYVWQNGGKVLLSSFIKEVGNTVWCGVPATSVERIVNRNLRIHKINSLISLA